MVIHFIPGEGGRERVLFLEREGEWLLTGGIGGGGGGEEGESTEKGALEEMRERNGEEFSTGKREGGRKFIPLQREHLGELS